MLVMVTAPVSASDETWLDCIGDLEHQDEPDRDCLGELSLCYDGDLDCAPERADLCPENVDSAVVCHHFLEANASAAAKCTDRPLATGWRELHYTASADADVYVDATEAWVTYKTLAETRIVPFSNPAWGNTESDEDADYQVLVDRGTYGDVGVSDSARIQYDPNKPYDGSSFYGHAEADAVIEGYFISGAAVGWDDDVDDDRKDRSCEAQVNV